MRDESAAGGAVTDLVFSGGTSVQEYSGTISTTNLAVEYVRGSDYGGGVGGILYTLRGGTPSYTHENKRGDVVAKTNASGSLTYQAQYEAFGKQVATSGSTLDRQKSNSKDTDPTNLIDEGFRYRDLETGMFINRDPAGFVDGPNLYTYVVQNPWTKYDPEGLTLADLNQYWTGIGNGFINMGEGAVHSVEHPVATAEGLASAVSHPIQTATAIKDAAVKSYNSGPEGQGELTANVLGALVPGAAAANVVKGVGAVAKVDQAVVAANAAGKAAGVGTADAKLAEAAELNTKVPPSDPSGSATIIQHDSHYSVMIESGDESLHTHQVITSDDYSSTEISTAGASDPGQVTAKVKIPLPNAAAAIARQKQLLNAGDLGTYDTVNNSCVSHVCDVLEAGGAKPPPPGGSAQYRFIKNQLKGDSPPPPQPPEKQ